MIVARFPDGVSYSASGWRELELVLRAVCVHPARTRAEFREEMRERALVWSGVEPGPARTSAEFLRSLAACRLFRIEDDG